MLTVPVDSKPLEEMGTESLATSELELGGMHCSACAARIRTHSRSPAGSGECVGQSGDYESVRHL